MRQVHRKGTCSKCHRTGIPFVKNTQVCVVCFQEINEHRQSGVILKTEREKTGNYWECDKKSCRKKAIAIIEVLDARHHVYYACAKHGNQVMYGEKSFKEVQEPLPIKVWFLTGKDE